MEKANRKQTGTIFNIQKFSIHDGPGIRTVVFFKGCPLRCAWCSNPESQLTQPQILWNQKDCLHCLRCVQNCPCQALVYQNNKIITKPHLCKHCKNCIQTCPSHALTNEGEIESVDEIIKIVKQDQVFYEESGGGITLSGGEFTMQKDFALELLKASKEEGLHTCCETTGFVNEETFKTFLPYLDLLLFDMKHYDPLLHKQATHVTNALPIANMKQAISMGKEVLPRIPVIPHFNDSLEDAKKFCLLLKEIGALSCQLLPFHQFGENKYHLLNLHYDYENVPSLHEEDLKDYLEVFLQEGIHAFF